MRDILGLALASVGVALADINRQINIPVDPQQGVDWFNAAIEYSAIGVLAYIFYRLWDRSQKRQNEVVNDRIAELEKERDYWREHAIKADDAHLSEVKNNREQYREFLLPYLTISPVPLPSGDSGENE